MVPPIGKLAPLDTPLSTMDTMSFAGATTLDNTTLNRRFCELLANITGWTNVVGLVGGVAGPPGGVVNALTPTDARNGDIRRGQWSDRDYARLTHALASTPLFQSADLKTQEELLRTTQLVYSCQSGKMVPRLREPRQLYGLNSNDFGPHQIARWPSDVQVVTDRIRHIEYEPATPEPFYKHTGLEATPMARSHEGNYRIVYEYEPNIGNFFMRSSVGGIRANCTQASVASNPEPGQEPDNTLIFESRFESGNLGRAVQVGDTSYELWLRRDLYTTKHMQWYYFRISNARPDVNYRFTIVNLIKPDSLYNYGMKPLLYSEKDAEQNKIGWNRQGDNIKYYRNNIKYTVGKLERNYYSLTWTCSFKFKDDRVYFAHCFPYVYSDLQDYLNDIINDPVKCRLCKQRMLCRTLAGNMVYILTITSPTKNNSEAKHRKGVVITARIHPGESNSSLMMKGFIDYLVGNTADAKTLRDNFVFKIVPMLNPDGVIVGNYRCSLAGRDLNRNYRTMLKESFPSVWHTKLMTKKLMEDREIVMYLDLHGHSRKQNIFIYGCENRGCNSRRLRERIFPVMLSRNAPDKFSYESCKFKMQRNKEGTGRIVMWNMGIMNSYTMEATFCGSSLGNGAGFHFSVKDFASMGYHFCDTLLDYCDPSSTKSIKILCDLEERLKADILQRLRSQEDSDSFKAIDDISLDLDYMSAIESSDGGSDSSFSDGLPIHLQYMSDKYPKTKRLKTKKDRDKNKQRQQQQQQHQQQQQQQQQQNQQQQQQQPSKKTVAPITNTSLRYTNSGKRGKEDRPTFIFGVPVFTQERMDCRARKVSSGHLRPTECCRADGDRVEIPHFRYTASDRCLEVAKVTQYAAHLQQHKYPDILQDTPDIRPEITMPVTTTTSNPSVLVTQLTKASSFPTNQISNDALSTNKESQEEEYALQKKIAHCINRGYSATRYRPTTIATATPAAGSTCSPTTPLLRTLSASSVSHAPLVSAPLAPGKPSTNQGLRRRHNTHGQIVVIHDLPRSSLDSSLKNHRQISENIQFKNNRSCDLLRNPASSDKTGTPSHHLDNQQELNNSIRNFNEIKHSLLDENKKTKLSPTTGQFVDYFVKKTEAELHDITEPGVSSSLVARRSPSTTHQGAASHATSAHQGAALNKHKLARWHGLTGQNTRAFKGRNIEEKDIYTIPSSSTDNKQQNPRTHSQPPSEGAIQKQPRYTKEQIDRSIYRGYNANSTSESSGFSPPLGGPVIDQENIKAEPKDNAKDFKNTVHTRWAQNPNRTLPKCGLVNKSPPQHDAHRSRTTNSRSPPGPAHNTASNPAHSRDSAPTQTSAVPRTHPPTPAKISLMITRHAHHASSGLFHAHSLTRSSGQWPGGHSGRNNKR